MRRVKKILKFLGYTFLVLIGLLVGLFIYLAVVSIEHPPKIANENKVKKERNEPSPGLFTLNNSWFRKSNSGLYELYVEGEAYERGVTNGVLTKELVNRQEIYFTDQISEMIPSRFYQRFLKYFIGWFNRNLADNVSEEYKREIYGISKSASDQFSYIGTNYQRILNYHAAHDIGHALQSMALVGCTSFGTWDSKSEDSSMIIGRNFDFYVGDNFAEDKIVAFFAPDSGYKFMTVTWGGFVGAVSGMNERGLTVTINAAKTNMPSGSATPVSLVAREILQYAQNIEEAVNIAASREMFVAESFLVASSADNKAVVIEKTPDSLDVYDPRQDYIVCANHFQSPGLVNSPENLEQIKESASPYRYKRLMQLLETNGPNTVKKTVDILRNPYGLDDAPIGLGNEKAINQFIAHHAIVFEPHKRLVWVSTSPWQMGQFVAYDLTKVFSYAGMKTNQEVASGELNIAADSFLLSKPFQQFEAFRSYKQRLNKGGTVNLDSLLLSNPNYYHTYVLAGDYLFEEKNYGQAVKMYEKALTLEIATIAEKEHIKSQLAKCRKQLNL